MTKNSVVRLALRLTGVTVQCPGLVPQIAYLSGGYTAGHGLPCVPYVDVPLCSDRTSSCEHGGLPLHDIADVGETSH